MPASLAELAVFMWKMAETLDRSLNIRAAAVVFMDH